MKDFNLSEWALEHQSLVLFFMLALFAVGLFSYFRLGQAEDPQFTFKVMVIRALWPGASPAEVDDTYAKMTGAGHRSKTAPWDAFWNQRYAQIIDPDGNVVDLFAALRS